MNPNESIIIWDAMERCSLRYPDRGEGFRIFRTPTSVCLQKFYYAGVMINIELSPNEVVKTINALENIKHGQEIIIYDALVEYRKTIAKGVKPSYEDFDDGFLINKHPLFKSPPPGITYIEMLSTDLHNFTYFGHNEYCRKDIMTTIILTPERVKKTIEALQKSLVGEFVGQFKRSPKSYAVWTMEVEGV